jgi:DNA processing protein
MSDAIIVVESAIKGGSLITADIANSYDKDIYALPGRINDPYSLGCNKLLYDHKASIIDSIPGLIFSLGYQKNKPNKQSQQMQMDLHLSADEKLVYNELSKGEQTIDDLFFYTKISVSKLALVLLDLEFKNLVKSLPGKKYALAYSMG